MDIGRFYNDLLIFAGGDTFLFDCFIYMSVIVCFLSLVFYRLFLSLVFLQMLMSEKFYPDQNFLLL